MSKGQNEEMDKVVETVINNSQRENRNDDYLVLQMEEEERDDVTKDCENRKEKKVEDYCVATEESKDEYGNAISENVEGE